MKPTTIQLKIYMRSALRDHVDLTGEVSRTQLAEDAAAHFNDYEDDDIPETYFEMSDAVATELENR